MDTPPRVVGVRFRPAGKLYLFDSQGMDFKRGERVVVETDRGLDIGWIVFAPREMSLVEGQEPPKVVVRKALGEDEQRQGDLEVRGRDALRIAQGHVNELELPMKLLEARYSLDGRRLVIQFSSEQRVDFRPLLHKLGESLRVKVELRQVGPRDEAKLTGGIGRCGLALCCSQWLCEFCSVTVRMAKRQSLPISAQNLAGQCGRLRCCLRFEYEQYDASGKVGAEPDEPAEAEGE